MVTKQEVMDYLDDLTTEEVESFGSMTYGQVVAKKFNLTEEEAGKLYNSLPLRFRKHNDYHL